MSATDLENLKKTQSARRLCELFRGRISEEIGKKLVEDLGGELEAADFLLHEDKEVVARYLKENTSYLEQLRCDSQKVADQLEKGIEYEIRQFACGPCDSSWWKKVPIRKAVCKCKRCHEKYDPVPNDKEWGWAKFICTCGNEFNAFGEMGVTKCKCYKCEFMVPVHSVLPQRKRIGQRKSKSTHSCDAADCYNRETGYAMPTINMMSQNSEHKSHHNNITYNIKADTGNSNGLQNSKKTNANAATASGSASVVMGTTDTPSGAYPTDPASKVCIHPTSRRKGRRVRTESNKHLSTGSTVSTFMTQGSLDTKSIGSLQSNQI